MGMGKVRRIGLLTAGGDCPGLNAVIRAVTKTAHNDYGANVIGIEDGYIGFVEGRGRILSNRDVSGILPQGGTILGTARGNPFEAAGKKEGDYSCFVRAFDDLKIDALICTGGDGTLTMASKLYEHGFPVVGIPKTIDNDVMETDYTFGFDSAVTIIMNAIDILHSTAMSHHRVLVVEVMGRFVGWLELVAGVAGGGDVILIPEIPYEEGVIFERVLERSRVGKRFSIVVVAEGVKVRGRILGEEEKGRIKFGGIGAYISHLIEDATGLETRPVVLGHLQRGGPPTAFDRILATNLAVKAIDLVMEGKFGQMSAIKGNRITSVPLARAVRRLKVVPKNHYIIRSATAVGTSFGVRE
ncbi:MAG: ATP-dependent 6-phosphofructokinase [Candidatus Sumerlaeota bacterium]|nr:ATP-dependent 6-phosphofructokinase [Candidatus Sumerlaeota bacterium]